MRHLLIFSYLIAALASAQGPAGDDEAQDEAVSASGADAQAEAETEAAASADSGTQAEAGGVKTLSGMSILGNEEAPKALVIVPWKSSRIGDGLGVDNSMDDRARPVDKEVFLREVHYYELREGAAD